jgi:nucleoside-diphosphate-sugar epimerase
MGFLGRQLCKLILEKGVIASHVNGTPEKVEQIVLFDVTSSGAKDDDPRIVIKTGDISDPQVCIDLVEENMAVFHLAGIMSGQGEADFDLCLKINFEGTRNMLEAVRKRGQCGRFVFTSAGAVFGETDGPKVSDRTKMLPLNTYGITKAMCEMLINDYTRKKFLDGRSARLPTVMVRPGLPNAATTSCFSGVAREPFNGVDVELPLTGDLQHAVTGVRTLIKGLLALYEAPAEKMAALGSDRCVNFPSISTNLDSIIKAIHKVAQSNDAVDAEKLGKIIFKPDPRLCNIVKNMAIETDYERAVSLGLPVNTTVEDILQEYIEDFGAGQGAIKAMPPNKKARK